MRVDTAQAPLVPHVDPNILYLTTCSRVQIRECVGLATSRTENDAGSAVVEQDKTHLALHMVCRGSSLALAHLDEDADDALRHTQLDRHSQLDPIEIEKAPRRCR